MNDDTYQGRRHRSPTELERLFAEAAQLEVEKIRRLAEHGRAANYPDFGRGIARVTELKDAYRQAEALLGAGHVKALRRRSHAALWGSAAKRQRLSSFAAWERWTDQVVERVGRPIAGRLRQLTYLLMFFLVPWLGLSALEQFVPSEYTPGYIWMLSVSQTLAFAALGALMAVVGLMMLGVAWLPLRPAHATDALVYAALAHAVRQRRDKRALSALQDAPLGWEDALLGPWQAASTGRPAVITRLGAAGVAIVVWVLLVFGLLMILIGVGVPLEGEFTRVLLGTMGLLMAFSGAAWAAGDVRAIVSDRRLANIVPRVPAIALGGGLVVLGFAFVVGASYRA